MGQTMSETDSQATAEAQTEFFNKIAKFSKVAYKRLRPAMGNLKRFAGPHAEALLGLTPVGQMLGIGEEGSFDQLGGKTHKASYNKGGGGGYRMPQVP